MARLVLEVPLVKTAAGWLVAAMVLAVIAWTGTYLYWHLKIVGALRTLDTPVIDAETEAASDFLNEAGCRTLPYLVASLDPKRNTIFLTLVTSQIAFTAADPGEPILSNMRVRERLGEWRIEKADSPAERQRKCETIRDWWRENGAQYHQVWRVWSSQCAR